MFKKVFIVIILICLFIGICYGNAVYLNPKQLHARTNTIKSEKIDSDTDGLLVLYFSDLHYGNYLDEDYLNKLINKINDFDPDIVIFGGDLISDTTDDNRDLLTSYLKQITSNYGKYAVLGDEDNYDLVNSIYEDSNFELIDTNRTIYIDKDSTINLVSLKTEDNNYSEAFYGIKDSSFTFVIGHYPDLFDDILNSYHFDYYLAGHSLGGQVYIPLVSLFNRPIGAKHYLKGKTHRNNITLDITNGIGYKNYHARLLADSEIVTYKLKSK